MANGNSMKATPKKSGSIGKANEAAYKVKNDSDKGTAHGSRPSHINNPGKSAMKA